MSVPTLGPAREDLPGTDLRLLGDLLTAEQRERGADLVVGPRASSTDETPDAAPGGSERNDDLVRVTGYENLQQALLLRFLTEVGELAHLGHPTYGSRLHELIGQPNTPAVRDRARLYALQALTAEPRVAQVRTLTVTTDLTDRTTILVRAAVVAIDRVTELNLVFPVPLAGGAL